MKSFAIIDLNDTNIRVASGDQILVHSPGYAVIKDNKIAFGSQAAKLTRIYPRSTHNDFWYRLGQDTIQSTSNQIRHNADLAYMQLAEINEQAGKPVSWLIAVPSSFNQEQLGLLLGLLKAANFQDTKLVDSALLASINALKKGEHLHLDIQLHQSVLTRLETDNNHKVIATEVLPEVGMLNIYEQCAKLINNEFINQSRFDPHHNAETEQLLFEKIPACLSTLTSTSMTKVNIEYQAQSYSANITHEAILEHLSPLYELIYKHIKISDQLLLSHRFGDLPSFLDGISNATILDEFALFTAAKNYSTYLRDTDSGTNYLSELPALEVAEKPTNTNKENTQTTDITHILIDDTAYHLSEQDYFFTAADKIETSLNANTQFSIQFNNGQYFIQTENNAQVSLNDVIIINKQSISLGDRIKATGSKISSILIKVS
jgi:hypothetical protein